MPGKMLYRIILTLLLVVPACGSGGGQQRTSFELVAGGAEPAAEFVNDWDWSITLDSALLAIGPIYFFDGEPLLTRRRAPARFRLADLLRWLSPVGTAHAHPGHYVAGQALGQLLEQRVVDLLAATPTTLGTVEGVTGAYNSARIDLHPAAADNGEGLGAHTLLVSGQATRPGDEPVAFTGLLDSEQQIVGTPCLVDIDGGAGRMTLAVDFRIWFKRVQFETLAEPRDDGRYHFTDATDSQAYNALVRGVESTGAFSFGWTAP